MPYPLLAFYWYNSAMYYIGFYSLFLLLVSAILLGIKAEIPRKRITLGAFVALFSFLIGGSNFVTALVSLVTLALFCAACFVFKLRGRIVPVVGLLALCVSFTISALAPGNAERQIALQAEGMYSMSPVKAVILSFWYGLKPLILPSWAVVLLIYCCLTPTLFKIARASKFSFKLPGLVSFLTYGVYASSYTANLYTMSSLGPYRVMNVNYLLLLLFMLLTLIYWLGWIARKVESSAAGNRKKEKTFQKDNTEAWAVGLLTVCCILGCVIISSNNRNAFVGVSGFHSLVSGNARTYYLENQERLKIYENPEIKEVYVPKLTVFPYLVATGDISENPDENKVIARYYDKDLIATID